MTQHFREWLCQLYSDERTAIGGKIRRFSDSPSQRQKWMAENLTSLIFREDGPLWTNLQRASLFYLIYEVEGKVAQRGSSSYKWSEDIRSVYRAKIGSRLDVELSDVDDLHLLSTLPNLTQFPPGSWALQFTFTLRKPYISRDDTDFYILDNPVKKEWVFKVPYVAPSQWKGALRAAMRRLRGYTTWEEEAQDEQMVRLFGNVKGEETEFSAGRLHFYPTFFDRIGLEVINPHDRETGAGKLPIYFECVPAGTQGTFTLLYVPVDAGPADTATCKADLSAVAQGIRVMLTVYGFGAKTSSGYGVAEANKSASRVQANGIADAERIFWEAWDEPD